MSLLYPALMLRTFYAFEVQYSLHCDGIKDSVTSVELLFEGNSTNFG